MFCLQSNNASLDVGRRQLAFSVMNENEGADGRQVMMKCHGQGPGWHRWKEGGGGPARVRSRIKLEEYFSCSPVQVTYPKRLPAWPRPHAGAASEGPFAEAAPRYSVVLVGPALWLGFLNVSQFLMLPFLNENAQIAILRGC